MPRLPTLPSRGLRRLLQLLGLRNKVVLGHTHHFGVRIQGHFKVKRILSLILLFLAKAIHVLRDVVDLCVNVVAKLKHGPGRLILQGSIVRVAISNCRQWSLAWGVRRQRLLKLLLANLILVEHRVRGLRW